MRPSILISSPGPVVLEQVKTFNVARGESATLFAQGLNGVETVSLEIQTLDVQEGAEEVWLPLKLNGGLVTLTGNTNYMGINSPGRYRVRIALSAGPVTVGVY